MSTPPRISGTHRVAELIPGPTNEEYEGLRADIQANGQRMPILVTPNGEIIDGRSRYRACQELGIEPQVEVYHKLDLEEHVCSLNIHRRHLSTSQRAALATRVLPMLEKRAQARQYLGRKKAAGDLPQRFAEGPTTEKPPESGEARELAAKMFSTNRTYVRDAEHLREEEPRLFGEVEAGKLTLSEAKRRAKADGNKMVREALRSSRKNFKDALLARDEDLRLERESPHGNLPYWVTWALAFNGKLGGLQESLALLRKKVEDKLYIQLNEHADVKRNLLRTMRRVETELREAQKLLSCHAPFAPW